MTFTLTSSAAIIYKAGANISDSAASSNGLMEEIGKQAEETICAETRVDWATNYTSVNTNFQKILDNACSALAAIFLINYDASAIGTNEATTRRNVLFTEYQRLIKELKDSEVRRAMGVNT